MESLRVCQIGQEECEPLHQYGPAVRDHILLHFVASGKGSFYSRGEIYPVSTGQGFAIFPDQLTTYRADKHDPWRYSWVGYVGFEAEVLSRRVGLSREQPIYEVSDIKRAVSLIAQMRIDAANLRMGAMSAVGGLYQLLSIIGEGQRTATQDDAQSDFEKAMWFMQGNYSRSITVEDVADYVRLSRSQLFRVFKRAIGTGPKRCLSEIRAKRAQALIADSSLTLFAVAASVGLSSGARLNALLKEITGISAGEYQRRLQQK